MRTIIDRLSKIRRERKIPLRTLAARMGRHFTTLGEYERHESEPSLEALDAWARALGVEIRVGDIVPRPPLNPWQQAFLDAAEEAAPYLTERRANVLRSLLDAEPRPVAVADQAED